MRLLALAALQVAKYWLDGYDTQNFQGSGFRCTQVSHTQRM